MTDNYLANAGCLDWPEDESRIDVIGTNGNDGSITPLAKLSTKRTQTVFTRCTVKTSETTYGAKVRMSLTQC